MKLLKPIMLAAIMGQSLISANQAPIERVKWMDKMFYTVNKNIELDAPVWVNTAERRNEYGTKFMKSLITQAHEVAKDYLKYKDYQAYNSFMMLALTFPLHEGLYMSFRETHDQKGLCFADANSGDIMFKESKQKIAQTVAENFVEVVTDKSKLSQLEALKNIDTENYDKLKELVIADYTRALLDDKKESIANTDKPSNYRHFVKYLKGAPNPFVVECSDVANDDVIRQFIRGADGTDIGPVQLSLRWHFDEFIAKKKYLSLDQTLKYGLSYIHEGFKKIYYDSQSKSNKDYPCIKSGTNIDFEKLVRATWSGKYNQGQVSKSCRIQDGEGLEAAEKDLAKLESQLKKSRKKSEKLKLETRVADATERVKMIKRHPDFHFNNNLHKVADFKSKTNIGYIDNISFAPEKNVKEAINEIISNFNGGKANGSQFSKIESLVK